MGLFDSLFNSVRTDIKKPTNTVANTVLPVIRDSPDSFVDSRTITPDERPYYQPDSYYTFHSYPGTGMGSRVVTFEERKRISYPSARGLYVGEILLLEYCNKGLYPKPKSGYPAFWWFEFGIRDIGNMLASLAWRGFLRWAPKSASVKNLTVAELKKILTDAGFPALGNKPDLVNAVLRKIPEERLVIPNYVPKYELTELGKAELEDNGYVPYMFQHRSKTVESSMFGPSFCVWDINKLFPNGDARNWRKVVGEIEKKQFGIDWANAVVERQTAKPTRRSAVDQRDEMRSYLASKQLEIRNGIHTKGDGFEEESQGLHYKSIGDDKQALVKFYISIGKRFDAPALYSQTAILLRKYGLYEEELGVIDAGLKNGIKAEAFREEMLKRREKALELIRKRDASVLHVSSEE